MRIGLIAPPWLCVPPERYGGIELIIDGLARGLDAAGHEVYLAARRGSECPVPQIPSPLLRPCDQIGAIVPEIRHVVESYRVLAGLEVDVIHDHTLLGPLVVGSSQPVPVVTTNHGPFDDDMKTLYRLMDRRTGIIAISRDQAASAAPLQIAGLIHHGIDVGEYPIGDGAGGYALFLGRMTPDKGVATAIDVATQVGVPLKIAAKMREPGEQRYFHEHVEPRLGREVEFVGEVGPEEKRELLGGALALLNPIEWPEPFGLVMVEAMACGTPVISTCWGAAPEIVAHGSTGYIAHTPTDLAAALTSVAAISRATCRRHVSEHFSTGRMVADHIELYGSRLNMSTAPTSISA
jgi:glycosyltransferase involved in cell wall biosynthesis